MKRIDTIVIGAGQAGLAASACLTDAGIDHLVLDRGAVAQRWRTERWASLRLLTPNWMTRLPGHTHDGPDPNGYMHKDEVTAFLMRYARRIDAPIRSHSVVRSVSRHGEQFRVATDTDTFLARSVVIATGACDVPAKPAWAARLGSRFAQLTTRDYVHPGQVEPGGVLVVGASATGVQLADEIRQAGHDVTIAAGRHVPLPRVYRGRDVMAWMDAAGVLTETRDRSVPRARTLSHPSLQLVGGRPRRDISLDTLSAAGVRPVSRVVAAEGGRLLLSGDLDAERQAAAQRATRLMERIDTFIDLHDVDAPSAGDRPAPIAYPDDPRMLDLDRAGIRTIVWATGFRRNYSWLQVPVLDARGELVETGGVTPVPGLYALGLPFMRRRNSAFIDGVGQDAREIVAHLARHLGQSTAPEAA